MERQQKVSQMKRLTLLYLKKNPNSKFYNSMVDCNKSPWFCGVTIDCHENLLTEFDNFFPFCVVHSRLCQRCSNSTGPKSNGHLHLQKEGHVPCRKAQTHIYMEFICVRPETQLEVGSMDISKKCKKHFHKFITHSSTQLPIFRAIP